MSAIPPSGPSPNPYSPGVGPGAASPELLSQASNAFNLALGGLIVGFCCCGFVGLILSIMAMSNAGNVLTLAAPGSEAHGKASTAKTLAIVGIVLSAINLIANSIGGALSMMNQ